MKLDEYGITCSLAIRSLKGVEECGPYNLLQDIPEEYFQYLVWLSIRDHNGDEIIYIRGRDHNGDIKVQLISNTNVIDYSYNSDKPLSVKIIIELIADIVSQHRDSSIEYIERLQSVQKNLT